MEYAPENESLKQLIVSYLKQRDETVLPKHAAKTEQNAVFVKSIESLTLAFDAFHDIPGNRIKAAQCLIAYAIAAEALKGSSDLVAIPAPAGFQFPQESEVQACDIIICRVTNCNQYSPICGIQCTTEQKAIEYAGIDHLTVVNLPLSQLYGLSKRNGKNALNQIFAYLHDGKSIGYAVNNTDGMAVFTMDDFIEDCLKTQLVNASLPTQHA